MAALAKLEALAPEAPRVLLSTGKLVGEGFDHPPLDTLVLAMPTGLWFGLLALPVLAVAIGWVTAQATVRRWLRRLP